MRLSVLILQLMLLGPSGMFFWGINALLLGAQFHTDWLIIGIFGSIVSGIVSLICSAILFLPVYNRFHLSNHYMSTSDVFFKYLPVLSFPIVLLITGLILENERPDKIYVSFLITIYLNFITSWYFIATYLSKMNNSKLKF